MACYLDPRNDLTFKRIFGEHPDLLIDFLKALMPFPAERQIKEVEYLPAEQVPYIPGKKNSIVDVKCRDSNNGVFIISNRYLRKVIHVIHVQNNQKSKICSSIISKSRSATCGSTKPKTSSASSGWR